MVQDEQEPVVVQDEKVRVADVPKKKKKKSRKSLERWLRKRAAATLIQRVIRGFLARLVYKHQIRGCLRMIKRDHERKVKFMKMRWKENWNLHMNDPMPVDSDEDDWEDRGWELEQDIAYYKWEQREIL